MSGPFNLTNRDQLQSDQPEVAKTAVTNELDSLTTALSAWALVAHNDDGSHNTRTTVGLDFVPVGGMIRWPLSTPPTAWLNCDGSAISRSAYPLLFKVLGTSSGAGDGSTTFNLPTVANFIILSA